MTATIVDTNVILVANNQHEEVSLLCILSSIKHLQNIATSGHVVIDGNFLILGEYLHKTDVGKAPGVGDKFVKWILQNSANPLRCTQLVLQAYSEHEFAEFPDDPDLQNFDPPDRKFVAVAAAHPEKPPILQAADCKWLDWESALNRHGINVEFICKDDVERFHKKKFGSNG